MASSQQNVEQRKPILRDAEQLEIRLALDGILLSGFVQELTEKDHFLSGGMEKKPNNQ